jgi:hypothetical protein
MRYLMFGFFLLTTSIAGQVEHAPTVAQCQADQRLWLSKLEENTPQQLPSFTVLNKWKNEMNDCQSVDPSNRLKYYNTQSETDAEQSKRMINFIDRQGLLDKFLKEDEAGKR